MLEPWALQNASLKKRIASYLFERANLEGASAIHCSSGEAPGVRRFGLSTPIVCLPNGIYLPRLAKRVGRPAWLPADGRRTLLFLGRLHPKKGIRETLEAWSLLRQRHPVASSWRLVVAGWDDGGHAYALAQHAHRLGLSDVLFPGPLFGEAKRQALAHANGFVLASHSEGLPMSVLEAWAFQLPVLMTSQCNLPEGFAAGAAMEVTPHSDRMAEELAAFLDLPEEERLAMGDRGRQLVEERFDWSAIAAQMFAVYAWVLGQQERPTFVRVD
jgi:poly(glycerol-phosphate) alpha-glucosyltransferase